MFHKNSRYKDIETISVNDKQGREVQAIKLRRLNNTTGYEYMVMDGEQLDVISEQRYKEAARFWHIADANCELEANELMQTASRIIKVPKS